ncbi:SUMF1/EgtB/PvdO family nonheme iron enzyme, partial [Rhodomicrobium vannielii ATCC 17100]|uniref:formylglycine-generating enzyme family protein n=1 Tax=Rhodomicrobium vannielii TaxID=1069 RepID=UPI001918EEE4
RYPTGDTVREDQALFYQNRDPVDVGSYPPNAFGLYDTIGNKASWAEDCWNKDYVGAPADGSAWLSGYCDWHVLRGANSRDDREDLRSAHRKGLEAEAAGGIRVARDLEPGEAVTPEAQKRRTCEDRVRAAFVRDGDAVAREKAAHEAASAEASRVTFEGWQLAFSILRYAIGEKQARDEGDRATERALRIQREALEAELKKNEADKAAAIRRREQAYAALQVANQNALLRKMSKECVSSQ